jgi:hypothetical protein
LQLDAALLHVIRYIHETCSPKERKKD